jgi:hypothetical protein
MQSFSVELQSVFIRHRNHHPQAVDGHDVILDLVDIVIEPDGGLQIGGSVIHSSIDPHNCGYCLVAKSLSNFFEHETNAFHRCVRNRKFGIAGRHYQPRASVDVFGANMAVGLYRMLACFASQWPGSNVSNFERRDPYVRQRS